MMELSLGRLVVLAAAGAAGTLSRYGLGSLAERMLGGRLPWGTLTVNLLGSLGFGIIWGMVIHKGMIPEAWKLPLLTGFMGAFTTFSTLAFDSARLLEAEAWWHLGFNLIAQPVLGLLLFLAGTALVRAL
jgi:CrcB protein